MYIKPIRDPAATATVQAETRRRPQTISQPGRKSKAQKANPGLSPAAASSRDVDHVYSQESECIDEPIPAMPTVTIARTARPHREKHRRPIFPACVALPVSRSEVNASREAKLARDKEWSNMRHKREVWRDSTVMEWRDVALRARRVHQTAHMARLFGI